MWAPVGIAETFNEVFAEGKVDEGLHGSWGCGGGVGNAVVPGGLEVAEDIFCSLEMAWGRVVLVLGKEGHHSGNVRTGGAAEPVEGPDNGTEGSLSDLAVGGEHVEVWDAVHWETRPERCTGRVGILKAKACQESVYVGGLAEVNSDVARGVALPVEGNLEVIADHAHEVDLSLGGKKTFKFGFDFVGRGVVDKVVHKVGKVEGGCSGRISPEKTQGE